MSGKKKKRKRLVVRDAAGRFKAVAGAFIDSKGYLCISAGPQRMIRVHRLLGAFKKGRPLTKDEDVHHANGQKLDFAYDNIVVLGHREHGCVSAKQHHYLKEHDIRLKSEWEEWFEQESKNVEQEIN